MKIDFLNQKISFVETSYNGVNLKGSLEKVSDKVINLNAHIFGEIPYICNRCGKDITLSLDENVDIILSNGVYNLQTLDNVIEFFDGKIDFDEVIQSEVESFKSDYFYCDECSKQ
ncbi:hypothetical protein [Campylobacter ureolyticus]|uniref:hypothetical protein n=1 Tax=Campylobacter ureolyticus TaxID=827 RepID=UPI0026F0EB51|nr:hypothetical protein [Campylobacter ureolyticus]